jgi:hypothetical protein
MRKWEKKEGERVRRWEGGKLGSREAGRRNESILAVGAVCSPELVEGLTAIDSVRHILVNGLYLKFSLDLSALSYELFAVSLLPLTLHLDPKPSTFYHLPSTQYFLP